MVNLLQSTHSPFLLQRMAIVRGIHFKSYEQPDETDFPIYRRTVSDYPSIFISQLFT